MRSSEEAEPLATDTDRGPLTEAPRTGSGQKRTLTPL